MSAGLCFRAASRETTPTVPSPMAGYSSSIDGNTEVTRAGITFQRAAASAGNTATSSAWASGDSTEFDGNYIGLSGTDAARFRLVLPSGAGSYALRVAHTLRAFLRSRVRIYDTDGTATLGSGTLLATSDASTQTIDADDPTDLGRYIDAAGTLQDFTVPLASSTASSAFSVSGGHVWVELSTIAGSFNCQVAALSLSAAGPQITAPAASASLTVEQGGTLSVPVTIARNGNTGDLTFRTQSGTPPSGVSMASVTITNPATTGTGSLVATESAPLVTADPMVFELVDGSTVVATVSVTVTVVAPTEGGGPGAGGAANAVTEQDNGVVLLYLSDEDGPLTTSTAEIRVAGVNSDTFNDRSATYRGEPGMYVYTLTTGERATRGMATIVLPNGEPMFVAVVEPGTMFSAVTSFSERFAQLAQGVILATIPTATDGPDGVRLAPLFNDLVVDVPVFLFGTGKTVRCRVCEFPEGDPAAIGSLSVTAMVEAGSLYTHTFDRDDYNDAVSPAYVGRTLWLHYDDGEGRHYVRPIRVVEYLSLGI